MCAACNKDIAENSTADEIITCELDGSVQQALADGTGKFACYWRW